MCGVARPRWGVGVGFGGVVTIGIVGEFPTKKAALGGGLGAESICTFLIGGARRDRTADLLNAIQALSQLSYGPVQKPAY